MASQGYKDWLAAGRPYTLIRPARALQATLRGYGLTVYDYPNADHLQANTPQDHTPFSVTGWPGTNKRWNARALDVMPRDDSAAARAENAAIARQLIRDRNAGVPGAMWIKYLNWTDEQGICRQERWTPGHTTVSSTDKSHVHISGRSDADTDDDANGYDPIARMRGLASGGDDMSLSEPVGWGKQFLPNPEGADAGPWLGGTLGNQLQHIRETTFSSYILDRLNTARITALTGVIEQLGDVITAGKGSVPVAEILAGVDKRLAELAEKLAAEQRDAVADLAEGGAAQVRADAD